MVMRKSQSVCSTTKSYLFMPYREIRINTNRRWSMMINVIINICIHIHKFYILAVLFAFVMKSLFLFVCTFLVVCLLCFTDVSISSISSVGVGHGIGLISCGRRGPHVIYSSTCLIGARLD